MQTQTMRFRRYTRDLFLPVSPYFAVMRGFASAIERYVVEIVLEVQLTFLTESSFTSCCIDLDDPDDPNSPQPSTLSNKPCPATRPPMSTLLSLLVITLHILIYLLLPCCNVFVYFWYGMVAKLIVGCSQNAFLFSPLK